jgi:hypothetical protein
VPVHHRIRRPLTAVFVAALLGLAAAAPPCGMLLSRYIEVAEGRVVPCLIDMTENGLCFRLPGVTLDAATRTLDAHLQNQGVPRPEWITTAAADGTLVPGPNGASLEIVIAADGPFSTTGTCRIVPER